MRPLLRRPPAAVVTLLAALALAACGPYYPEGTVPPPPPPPPPTGPTLLACPGSSFFPEGPQTITVPEGGGRVNFGNGHALVFERGSLPAGTRLVVSRALTDRAGVSIEPASGTLPPFGAPVLLTLNYAPCSPPATPEYSYRMYRVNSATGALVHAGGADVGRKVTVALGSFSVYAIGGNAVDGPTCP